MKQSRWISVFGIRGRVAAVLLGFMAVLIVVFGFSSSRQSSANAGNWLEQAFGDFSPRVRPKRRPRRYRRPPSSRSMEYRNNAVKYIKTRSRASRSGSKRRKLYSIGRINGAERLPKAKNRLFRVPEAATVKTYRTMCVRTCDGYFFPVSFATRKDRLRKDASICQSSCGSSVRLYYYPNPGGEIADMVSYRGERKYKDLKNAFLFKKQFVGECRCRPEPWTRASRERHARYARIEKKRLERLARRKSRAASRRLARRHETRRKRAGKHRRKKYSRLSRRHRARTLRRLAPRKVTRKRNIRKTYRVRRTNRISNWDF